MKSSTLSSLAPYYCSMFLATILALASVLNAGAQVDTLIGTKVTGTYTYPGGQNEFNPATVTIADPAIEFGNENSVSADFSANTLHIHEVIHGATPDDIDDGYQLTFTSLTPGAFNTLTPISNTFPNESPSQNSLTYSVSNNVITITRETFSGHRGQVCDATFKIEGSGFHLIDLNNNQEIKEGDTAYITGDDPPLMPKLQAVYNSGDANATVSWKFKVSYTRPNGHMVADDQIHYKGAGQTWDIFENYQPTDGSAPSFFGGNAELICTASGAKLPPLHFKILGKSPDPAVCRSFIDAQTNAPYYAYAIVKTESGPGYNQFYRAAGKLSYQQDGYPVWGNDGLDKDGNQTIGGFGLFQITGIAGGGIGDIPKEQLWNWEENVLEGLNILNEKIKKAPSRIAAQRAKAMNDGATGVIPQVSFPRDDRNKKGKIVTPVDPASPNYCVLFGGDADNGGVPQNATITFKDGTTETIVDAEAISLYNGGAFCKWNGSQWIFNRYTVLRDADGNKIRANKSYVDDVAAQLEENRVKPLP